MPELPEVETTVRGLQKPLQNNAIASADVRVEKLRFPIPQSVRNLSDTNIIGTRRRSKYVLIDLANEQTLMIHLGMSGRLVLDAPESKYDHVNFQLSQGQRLSLNDPRKFGLVDLTPTAQLNEHRLIAHLGPEPLTAAFDADYLYTQLKKRSSPVKVAIMDAKLVVGVGNIYANEALFRSRIRPTRKANRVTRTEAELLCQEIKAVLSEAIEAGGSSLRDYVQSDGKLGFFQDKFYVYDRLDQPCLVCQTPIKKITLGQRGTYYCPNCQPR